MRRLLWVGVGVAVTVVALRLVTQAGRDGGTAAALTPAGVAASLGSLPADLRDLGRRLREGMATHEETLRAALLPDEETLARARETRAARRRDGRDWYGGSDEDALPDDGTDYF